MKLPRFSVLVFGGFAAVAILLGGASQVLGQAGGGIVVDPGGTLRVKTVPDPYGRLTKKRIAHAKAALAPELARSSDLRKFSLIRLEAEIARCIATGEGICDEIRYLAGLTRIKHVFYYPETKDIVIAGPAEGFMHDLTGRVVGLETGRAVLELEDLVVALRAFPPAGGRTSTIGCSIDATPEGLARLQQFLMRTGGPASGSKQHVISYAKSMREALGKQNVTLFGISDKTHFAQVLVEADYRMKLIGIGLEVPHEKVKITSYVHRADPSAVARNAMQRWYFVPNYECVRVSPDELAMELVGDGVKLVGQHEVVGAAGARSESAMVDSASQAFVDNFTRQYPVLAEKVPVYGQLRNLIDMSIAAAYIQDRDLYTAAGWTLGALGDERAVPVEVHEAPKQVHTAVNAVWRDGTLMTPIGGGVEIQPHAALHDDRLLKDKDGSLSAAHLRAIDLKGEGHWWWD